MPSEWTTPGAHRAACVMPLADIKSDHRTDATRNERDLRESEQRFAKAFLSSPVAMVISHMEDGLVYDVNERWSALSGYTREAALGKTAAELRHWSDLAQRAAFVEQLKRDGAILNFEAQFRTRDGDERTVLASGEIIAICGKSRLLLALDDITARKRAEAAVRDSEAKFRSLVEGSIQGISVSRDSKLLFVNQALPPFSATQIQKKFSIFPRPICCSRRSSESASGSIVKGERAERPLTALTSLRDCAGTAPRSGWSIEPPLSNGPGVRRFYLRLSISRKSAPWPVNWLMPKRWRASGN